MKLGIYGSSGLGREIYEIAVRRNSATFLWDEIIFIDDFADEGEFHGSRRINFESLKTDKEEYECVIGVGEPSAREKLFQKLSNENIKLTQLIDPSAIISPTAQLSAGTIVCEFSTVHTGVELGYNTLVQPFCDVGHDIKVGNHTVLSPFCAPGGGTVFGERVFIGMKSAIMEKLTIGDDVIVGMGSVVFRDVPSGATVLGNPARITRGKDEHKVFS